MMNPVSQSSTVGKLVERRLSRRFWPSLMSSLLFVASLLATTGVFASRASAAAPAASWAIASVAMPTNFSDADTKDCLQNFCFEDVELPSRCDSYQVTVTNVGRRPSNGRIVVSDKLPIGVTLQRYEDAEVYAADYREINQMEYLAGGVAYNSAIEPGGVIKYVVEVTTDPGASGLVSNHVEVREGGVLVAVSAPPGTVANTLNGASSVFGFANFSTGVLDPGGVSDTQAGGHPATSTTNLDWATDIDKVAEYPVDEVQDARMQVVDLPSGLVGDAQVLGKCPLADVEDTFEVRSKCPADTQVGSVLAEGPGKAYVPPLYNVPPEAGYPAEFAFEYADNIITLLPRLLPSAQ